MVGGSLPSTLCLKIWPLKQELGIGALRGRVSCIQNSLPAPAGNRGEPSESLVRDNGLS